MNSFQLIDGLLDRIKQALHFLEPVLLRHLVQPILIQEREGNVEEVVYALVDVPGLKLLQEEVSLAE